MSDIFSGGARGEGKGWEEMRDFCLLLKEHPPLPPPPPGIHQCSQLMARCILLFPLPLSLFLSYLLTFVNLHPHSSSHYAKCTGCGTLSVCVLFFQMLRKTSLLFPPPCQTLLFFKIAFRRVILRENAKFRIFFFLLLNSLVFGNLS